MAFFGTIGKSLSATADSNLATFSASLHWASTYKKKILPRSKEKKSLYDAYTIWASFFSFAIIQWWNILQKKTDLGEKQIVLKSWTNITNESFFESNATYSTAWSSFDSKRLMYTLSHKSLAKCRRLFTTRWLAPFSNNTWTISAKTRNTTKNI